MSTTLSYGYVLPSSGDTGAEFFPAIQDNIQQLNDHNHDGNNSALLNASALAKGLVTAASGSWTLVSTGLYSQTLNVPAGYNVDTSVIYCKDATSNSPVNNEIEKLSSTQFKVYSNDNSVGVKVYFG